MELNETFVPLALEDLVDTAREYKEQGYQLAQMMGVLKEDDTVWLYYTFIKGNEVINRRIEGIIKGETEVPSLTPLYIAIFVNENEAHDLFGVNIVGNLIDFEGAFYRFAEGVEAPMSIVSPEQLAAREKAAKIAKAKAAKAAKAAKEKAAKEAEAAAPAEAPAEEQPQKQAEAASAPAPASAEASANTNEEGE
ncbi:MAG: NADH-quinone oxidoreductase subunit C [Eggerthellaceae bacterium]